MKKIFALFAFAMICSSAYALEEDTFDPVGCVIRCSQVGISSGQCGSICGG